MIPLLWTLGLSFVMALGVALVAAYKEPPSEYKTNAVVEFFLITLCTGSVLLEGIMSPGAAFFNLLIQHHVGFLYFGVACAAGVWLLVLGFMTWFGGSKVGSLGVSGWSVMLFLTMFMPLFLNRVVPWLWEGHVVVSVSVH